MTMAGIKGLVQPGGAAQITMQLHQQPECPWIAGQQFLLQAQAAAPDAAGG